MKKNNLENITNYIPNGMKKFLLLAGGLFSAGQIFATDIDYNDILNKLNSNTALVQFAEQRDAGVNRTQLGEAVELLGAVLANQLGFDYTVDGTFDTSYDLPKLKDFEKQLSSQFPELTQYAGQLTITPEEITLIRDIATDYLDSKINPVLPPTQVTVTSDARDDMWQTILTAKNIEDVSDVVGRGMGSLGYLDLARRAPISSSEFDEVVRNIYASAIYTTMEDAKKGIINPTQALNLVRQASLDYLQQTGSSISAIENTGVVAHSLEEMLDLGLPSLLEITSDLYKNSTDAKAQEQLSLIQKVNSIHNAANYMNAGFDISTGLILPLGVTPTSFATNDVSNGTFYASFDDLKNFPSANITLFDLLKLGFQYNEKTGSVSFAETGLDSEVIEGYRVNQTNLELEALFNVLGFLPETNGFNANLWLGAAYLNRGYSQDFNGVLIPRSENSESGIGFRSALDLYFNMSGHLLGLTGFFNTGLTTIPGQVGLEGGANLDYKYFFNGGYLGLGGTISGNSEPSTPNLDLQARLTGGVNAGPGSITLEAGYGTDGLTLKGGYRF